MPKSVVVDDHFDWGDDRPPNVPWSETIIYETHVKGISMRHPDVPEDLRGTYLGLASEPIVEHLRSLGVTAVELLPVHHFDRRQVPARQRPVQLLGLQLDWLLRAGRAVRQRRPRPAGDRVQRDGQAPARGRTRGLPRRGLQPHRRRQPPRPDAVVPRPGQPDLLQPDARQSALLPRLHRAPATRSTCQLADAEADRRQPALLGPGDARRRLPLRPGDHRWPASRRRTTRARRSSTSSTRTRSFRASS